MPAVEPCSEMLAHVPVGEVPAWAGTEVRDPDGVVLGRVAALRFDAITARPTELVIALADGTTESLSATGLRVRLDHVAVAARPGVRVSRPAPLAA